MLLKYDSKVYDTTAMQKFWDARYKESRELGYKHWEAEMDAEFFLADAKDRFKKSPTA